MSSGPTSTGEKCIEVTKKGRINVKIGIEEWCGYEGKCEIGLAINDIKNCWHCVHMARFNIPEIIKEEWRQKNGN